MFGRETIIALRARRQAHRIATDILLPRLHLPEQPLIIHAEEELRDYDEWSETDRRKHDRPTWMWLFAYLSLLLVFLSLVALITTVLDFFFIVK